MGNRIWKKSLAGLAVLAFVFGISTQVYAANWKMSFGDAAGGTQWETGKKFAEILEAKSNGKVKFGLFPNGQLGSEQDTVNDCSMGTLDFSVLAVNNLTPFSPSIGVLTLPYVIQGLDDAVALTQVSSVRNLLRTLLEMLV